MTKIRLPSLDIPEVQKHGYSEADVHSKLFDLDMTTALGYPSRFTTEADGEHFREQRTLAVRRLKSGAATGRFDGLYLIGNSPTVLCEIKRYNAIDGVLGYLNSALGTFFMKKIVNATATAHLGYVEKLPYRRPSAQLEAAVVERIERIVEALKADPDAQIQPLRDEIDELIFDLFEIRSSREEIRRFYETVGLVQDQAASE